MKKMFSRVAVLAVLAVAVFSVGGASAATGGGSATANSYLFRIKAGDTTISLGTDVAESARGAGASALARLIAAKAGSKTFGGGERTATKASESGSTKVAETEAIDVAGLLSLGSISGSIEAKVANAAVSSAVDVVLGAADLLGGVARIGSSSSETATTVTGSKAESVRSIKLDGIQVLAVGDLLAALKIDPLALACQAVEAVGGQVGVNTSQACEKLSAAQGAIDGAKATLEDAKSDLMAKKAELEAVVAGYEKSAVQADRDTVAGMACDALDLICQTNALTQLTTIASGYGVNLTGLSLDDAKAAVLAKLDQILAAFDALAGAIGDLNAVVGAITDAASGVCSDVVGALNTVGGAVPALAPVVGPIAGTIQNACDDLLGIVQALLDTPLLSVGEVDLSIRTVARANDPVAVVKGTVGSIKIGNLAPVALDLSIVGNQVKAITDTVAGALKGITDAIGLSLPTPEFELLAKDVDKGRRNDGTWFAKGSVSAVRVHLPSATLTLPDVEPLRLLGGSGLGIAAVQQVTPALTLDLGVFEAASEFSPSPAGGNDQPTDETTGKTLPVTGAGSSLPFVAAAAVLVLGAAHIRRWVGADF